MPLALTSSKDVLALRLKYSKTTLFLPCLPTHTLAVLKTSALQSLVSSGQQAPLEIESSFAELTPQDIKLFTASRAPDVSGAGLGPIVYRPLEEEGAKVDTVAAAGFKDGMEVFLGFRKKGDAKISQPQVQLPSLLDEEDEEEYEEDPDAIPPPLDDEDGLAPMVLDGEGKRKGKA